MNQNHPTSASQGTGKRRRRGGASTGRGGAGRRRGGAAAGGREGADGEGGHEHLPLLRASPRLASLGPRLRPRPPPARRAPVCLQSEPEPLAEAITAAATGEPGSDREAGGGRRPARRRPPWPRRAELGAAAAVALTAALLRRRQALRAPEAEGSRGRHSLVTVAAAHGEAPPPPPPLLTRRPAAASALPSGGGGRASLHAPAARAPGPTAAGVGGHRRWGTLPRAACRPAPSSGGMPTRGWSPIGLTPT
ncbi:uncharacterized protein [Castor canadensis]|uniref:Uncharacterized protein n=1 Tax=Castor canadensis TaxID=51338 RepID=A0AC58L799_CASCN